MTILAIDTSGPSASVAILKEDTLCYEATAQNKLTHSVNLMPMVQEALEHSGIGMGDITLFAAVVGPGSFTGVRIGVAAVKAMAQALAKPCIGVNALEALAMGANASDALVCPIRDARVGQVYGAAFENGRRVLEDVALMLPRYLARAAQLGRGFIFVGDGVNAYREDIVQLMGDTARFLPAHLNQLKAGAAAWIARRDAHLAVNALDLLPLYLRAPQAQRERESRA